MHYNFSHYSYNASCIPIVNRLLIVTYLYYDLILPFLMTSRLQKTFLDSYSVARERLYGRGHLEKERYLVTRFSTKRYIFVKMRDKNVIPPFLCRTRHEEGTAIFY